ncbi:flavin reductase family protein [Actinocorallia sp. A-T 12471]|uniref:flavin reductase family protein n=1 Tax=Actinocorallia sp. A-T 12471 TaxID=3089813 RepID=UPI0029CBA6B5|nr:flavin reductase family protein [Actinocorallia sp. A-T 12471]MDX6741183.1 flavin reductase family protein [Actinocorallia sp. A-T 12471]
MTNERRSVAPQVFRDMMAGVCAPVTVVTAVDGASPVGATVSSFASLSLDPPLVTVAFDRRSRVLERILAERRFGVNLLGHAQDDLAMLFASREPDRFARAAWHWDDGLPRLDGAAGWLDCDLYEAVEGGDHLLLLGHVVGAGRAELPPLVYAHRTFGTHSRYGERRRPPIADSLAALTR